jgi:hypothetical protein
MVNRALRWGALVLGVLLVARLPACGDDGGGPGGAPVPFEQYCDEYAEMACEVARICDCLQGYSVELCQTFLRAECVDEVEQPVNDGRVRYLPDQGGQCIAGQWSVARDCRVDDDEGWPEACDQMLEGLTPAGQGCADSGGTCADDHYCDAAEVCRAQQGAGAPCTDDEQCLSWDCVGDLCEPDTADSCPF